MHSATVHAALARTPPFDPHSHLYCTTHLAPPRALPCPPLALPCPPTQPCHAHP